MHIGIGKGSRNQVIQVGCLDRAAVEPKLSKACIIKYNEQNVGSILFGALGSGKAGSDRSAASYHTWERVVPCLCSFDGIYVSLSGQQKEGWRTFSYFAADRFDKSIIIPKSAIEPVSEPIAVPTTRPNIGTKKIMPSMPQKLPLIAPAPASFSV